MDGDLASSIVGYRQISAILVNKTLKLDDGLVDLIQVYAPDSTYPDEEYQDILDDVQEYQDGIDGRNRPILMRDFNARVGVDSAQNWSEVVGSLGLGWCNDRGRMTI